MHLRAIPRTGELLPPIGLGTWQTFDVGASRAEREPLDDVLRTLLESTNAGRAAPPQAVRSVIDSSPMYGRAEEVTGDELAKLGGTAFIATKVWTSGKQAGIDQMNRSLARLRAPIDLMQVHNLLDWQTHLPVLRDWKAAGTFRYLGVTHYQHAQFGTIEKLMRSEQLDFIQIPYSIVDRVAEARILPAARDTGTAVLVMTPFESGALFRQARGTPLPSWAGELGCASWAQVFLKFILGHPAVTCPIPATSSAAHLADNLGAGDGPLPDEALRATMAAALA
jgi:aryl-alcohol dehydrogenase-like predicted oxidoreductase